MLIVFLYKPLPKYWIESGIGAQNIEDGNWFKSAYKDSIEFASKTLRHLPESWGKSEWAPCLGVFVANDLDFVKQYTSEALDVLQNSKNIESWNSIKNQGCYSIVTEQWLAACAADSMNKKITYLCDGLDTQYLESIGYCHLWGAKKSEEVCNTVDFFSKTRLS